MRSKCIICHECTNNNEQSTTNPSDKGIICKTTLPIIYAMSHGSEEQAAIIRNALINGGLRDFEPVLKTMQQTGALDYTRTQAEISARAARDAIAMLPDSKYRDSLLELASFAVTRNY